VAAEARFIYPKFKKLLGRQPPSDRRERCFHGPDGKLDVYVTTARKIGSLKPPTGTAAFVHPYVADEVCLPKKPVFAIVRPGVRKAILAHELYHAFQAAYATKQKCHLYSEWNEALATWAGNFVYPDDNVEHDHPAVMTTPDFPMNFFGYATWVFPYYVTQLHGPQVIREIEEAREKYPNDTHVDKAIPGGFRQRFPEFALYAYNQAPVPGVPGIASTFRQWDRIPDVPKSVPAMNLTLGDQPVAMQTLRILTREYRRIVVADPRVRKVEFRNPTATNADLHVRALVKRADGRWTSENWDGRTTVDFCRDRPSEDVREIILAYSNSSYDNKLVPSTRFHTKDSCSLQYRVVGGSVNLQTNASADHILCGNQSGRITFTGSSGEPATTEPSQIEVEGGQVSGSIDARVKGGWSGHHLDGCKYESGSGYVPCSVDMPPREPLPDGKLPVSFSVSGGENDANWELDWSFDDPTVGFVDAGDDECNVSIWGYFDPEASKRTVPRATFLQTKPFTVTFAGSGTAPHTPNNTNATVNHEWSYSLTLQRVVD
jgi:hypothetical protein